MCPADSRCDTQLLVICEMINLSFVILKHASGVHGARRLLKGLVGLQNTQQTQLSNPMTMTKAEMGVEAQVISDCSAWVHAT